MKKISTSQKGFTLLEAVFVMALTAMVGAVVFGITRAGNQQNNARETRMTLQDNAREGLYKMVQEIRQSGPTKITLGAGTIQFSVPDPSSLTTGTGYALNWAGAHTIKYSVGGTNGTQILRLDMTTNKTAVIANDVTSAAFTGNGGLTVITVTLNVQHTTPEGRQIPATPLSLVAQAEVRNH